MESQSDINGKMRAILIDWLVEVHMKYKLRPETLFLTVNLIDRYLTRMPVMRKRLQLVGVVAMFIAAKFEEIHPPEVADFVYITDSAYTKEDILTMECQMLSTLDFQIVVPTAAHFMDRMQRLNGCDGVQREIAQYLIELALLDLRMIRHTPSHLCSAALLLSNELLGRPRAWPELMVQHVRHTEVQLRPCSEELRALLDGAPAHWLQAVRKKFLLPPHHAVAKMTF
jgi:cyclin B